MVLRVLRGCKFTQCRGDCKKSPIPYVSLQLMHNDVGIISMQHDDEWGVIYIYLLFNLLSLTGSVYISSTVVSKPCNCIYSND